MTYENYRADTKKGGRTPKEKINVKLHRMYTQSEGERERETETKWHGLREMGEQENNVIIRKIRQ